MPELSSFICFYLVFHIEGQYRNLKEVEKIKCYGDVLSVFFLKGKKKPTRREDQLKKGLHSWKMRILISW